jgi:hypothetical protein
MLMMMLYRQPNRQSSMLTVAGWQLIRDYEDVAAVNQQLEKM